MDQKIVDKSVKKSVMYYIDDVSERRHYLEITNMFVAKAIREKLQKDEGILLPDSVYFEQIVGGKHTTHWITEPVNQVSIDG